MLEFNLRGLLIPNINIPSSLNDLKNEFVDNLPSEIRNEIFDGYLKYLQLLKSLCDHKKLIQWIDGSFVTKDAKPSDIDLVTFIPYEIFKDKGSDLRELIYPKSLLYNVDAYVVCYYPEDHKDHFIYLSDKVYWMDRFDKTRPTRRHKRLPKGFLEIFV
jgi:hypothetical protein